MVFIESEQVKGAASYRDWTDSMERAFLLDPSADYIIPQRTHVDFEKNTLLLMPCISKKYISVKVVSLFPTNADIGKATLSGLVMLNDGSTGEPLAIIDGTTLTAMRTAAVGSVGVRHLSAAGVKNLGIIGLGIQGIHQALFACSERDFQRVYILDKLTGNIDSFRSAFSAVYPGVEIIVADNARQLCAECEVIITATNSSSPVMPDEEDIYYGKTIIGIGSYKPGMREFPDALFDAIDCMFVDTLHGMKESGDLMEPLNSGKLTEKQVVTIDEVIRGNVKPGQTSVFKSVGMALFDLFAAILVYESIKPEHHQK